MSKTEIEKFFSDDDDNTEIIAGDGWDEDFGGGQLSIDMYQTATDLVIKAPIAGVKKEDLDVVVTDDSITVRGKRERESKEEKDNFFVHECYWGSFSRVESLPVQVISEKARASLKDGVLTIHVPKANKERGRSLKIDTD
ncbi:Hsp20/alpha crystallin family protein [Candidatus Microgenomates bacterium]|nr:Hsp20/alpha crystallin family protein [Candidatus Microgenomates bacterium]